MTTNLDPQSQNAIWEDENVIKNLQLRVKTFYNKDYFERIVMPLLDLSPSGRVLDVGCGYGGLSFILAESRPDLQITGVDTAASMLARAAETAVENGLINLAFEQGDAHQLQYEHNQFDAVLCQTVLTHVRNPEGVVREMARVLKPDGVFMAAEYANLGVLFLYSSVDDEKRGEAWVQEYFRLSRMRIQGKKSIDRGDDEVGIRVPYLATHAGLDVFDVRLNDRVLHVIPPYRHTKQENYLEFLKAYYAPDQDKSRLSRMTDMIKAAGGTEEEATWLYNAEDDAALLRAIEERILTRISAYLLFLTFARKPSTSRDSR